MSLRRTKLRNARRALYDRPNFHFRAGPVLFPRVHLFSVMVGNEVTPNSAREIIDQIPGIYYPPKRRRINN